MSPASILRLSSQRFLRSRPYHLNSAAVPSFRLISTSRALLFPRKDTQDKDSINTESNEYSKSGGDKASANQEDAAFNPDKTEPEQQHDTAGKGIEGNPLDVSPANQEVSKPKGQEMSGTEQGAGDGKQRSGAGSPEKGKKV